MNQQNRFPEVIAPGINTAANLVLSTAYPWAVGEIAYATDTFQLFAGKDPATGGSFYPVPTAQKTVSLTGQTTTIGPTTLITPPVNGVFRLSFYIEVTTTAAIGTLAVAFGWTDDNGTATNTPVSSLTLTAAGYSQGQVIVRAKTTGTINYSVTLTGVTGSPQYSFYCFLERLF